MKPIKVMIVEDDLLIAECMRTTLVNEGYIVFDPVDSRHQALEMVKNMKPDLVLMDIRLEKQEEGIPIAQEIRKTYLLPIIFITQLHDKEVFKRAKEVFPKSYLTKPYNDSDLIRAVELAILNSEKWLKNRKINVIEQIKDGIYLTETGSTLKTKLLYEDILYIKAAKAYTEIYYEANGTIASKPYVVTLSSNNVFNQIASQSIIKVHRSFYVNTHKIVSFRNSSLIINSTRIPISHAHIDQVKNACQSIQYNRHKK